MSIFKKFIRDKEEPDKDWWDSFGKASELLTKVALFLAPLAFLPFGAYIGLGKQVIFGGLVLLAFCFWAISALFEGKIEFGNNVVTWMMGLLLLFSVVNFVLVGASYKTLFGISGNFLGFYNILVLSVLFWLLISRNKHPSTTEQSSGYGASETGEHKTSTKPKPETYTKSGLKWFLGGSGLAILFGIFQLFGVHVLPFSFAQSVSFNTVGSVNAVAILAGMVVAVSLGMFVKSQGRSKLVNFLLMTLGIFYILLVGYVPVWYGLLIASFVYFSQLVVNRARDEKDSLKLSSAGMFAVFGVLVFALVAVSFQFIAGNNVLNLSKTFNLNRPGEIGPTHSSSLSLAKKVYEEGAMNKLVGAGWATYGKKWSMYKRKVINESRFWQLTFNQGSSGFMTSLVEVGIIGTVVFLGFFLSIFWRAVRKSRWMILGGICFMLVMWFLYPFNFTLWVGVFVLAATAAKGK